MYYNDSDIENNHLPTELEAEELTGPYGAVFRIRLTDERDSVSSWLTPEAAVELAGELDEWVRSLDK
jgi:hypothetical protein